MKLLFVILLSLSSFINQEEWERKLNEENGYYIEYPTSWEYKEFWESRTVIFGPESMSFRPMVEIDVFEKKGRPKQYIKRNNKRIKKNGFIVDYYEKTGKKSYQYYYKCNWADIPLFRTVKFIFINRKVYKISLTCAKDEQDLYGEILERINDSFELKRN